jgi:hypothetical protein
MSDPVPTPRTPREFAEERSHRDAAASNETGRATAQAAILIKGGAATAVLAYLSKNGLDPSVLHTASWCLIGYGFGVIFGATMMFCMIRMLDYYNVRWRDLAHPDGSFPDSPADPHARAKAYRWWRFGLWCFGFAMFAFIASSTVVAWTLAHSKPAATEAKANTAEPK